MKTIKDRLLSLLFIGLVFSSLSSCSNDAERDVLTIRNGLLELGFDQQTGALISLHDLFNSYEYLDTSVSAASPWQIEIRSSESKHTLDLDTAPLTFQYKKINPHSLVLTWEQYSGLDDYKDLKVTATINLEQDKNFSYWKISIEGIGENKIAKVVFPRITGIRDIGDEYLAVPFWMGQLLKDPRSQLSEKSQGDRKYQWSYPGPLSMQCLALYDPECCGLYASCNDTLGYKKNFTLTLDNVENLSYELHHFPSADSKNNTYSPDYEAVIGTFKGDWLTVAEMYREWGEKQYWCRDSRLKNKQTPSWLNKTALWVWNRGRSENVLAPAADLQDQLGLPVSVFWHWWHGCAYDIGFPEYLPPREGREPFIQEVTKARGEGINSIVYMNHFQWGNATKSWTSENASQYAVKDMSGNMYTHVFNIFTGKALTNMCIATDFWQDKYASLCDSVINTYHISGVYMDQACASRMCFDPDHGHPQGGGKYWSESFTGLTGKIRKKTMAEKQSILTGEGALELRIPDLDAFLTLQVSKERFLGLEGWEAIPFFQAVYHPFAITYGNYSSLVLPPYDELWPAEYAPEEPLKLLDKGFQKQFMMEQARSFVWGMQPTIANYRGSLVSERKRETDFLFKLAKVRYRGLKYLLYGEYMRSPELEVPEEELQISKLSIYKGREEKAVTTSYKQFPTLYSGTWKSTDGHMGIAMANISDTSCPVSFEMSTINYQLPASGKIYMLGAGDRTQLGTYRDGKILVDFTLDREDLCIVEIIPNI